MAARHWQDSNGNWTVSADWAGGLVPGSTADVIFDAAGSETVWENAPSASLIDVPYFTIGVAGMALDITDVAGNQPGLGGFANSGSLGLGKATSLLITGAFANSNPLYVDSHSSVGGGSPAVGGTLANTSAVQVGDTSQDLSAAPMAIVVAAAAVPTLTTLVSFNGANGENPYAGLIADAAGDLFGTTQEGGTNGYGTVFEIAKTGAGFASAPTILANFNISNGAYPYSFLMPDAAGDLFGTTGYGGTYGDGTVFELAKTGSSLTFSTLVSFNGTDGTLPEDGLVTDAAGNLFGTTLDGGAYEDGAVFEVIKTGSGYATVPTTLVSFSATPAFPTANLIVDAAGDLFGTTRSSGANNDGMVFEVAKTSGGYASTATTLASFDGSDGAQSSSGLITDAAGDLFGTTTFNGPGGQGTIFEVAKTGAGYASAPTLLAGFSGANGSEPNS